MTFWDIDTWREYEAALPAVQPKSGAQAVYYFEGPAMRRPFQPTAFWTMTRRKHSIARLTLAGIG